MHQLCSPFQVQPSVLQVLNSPKGATLISLSHDDCFLAWLQRCMAGHPNQTMRSSPRVNNLFGLPCQLNPKSLNQACHTSQVEPIHHSTGHPGACCKAAVNLLSVNRRCMKDDDCFLPSKTIALFPSHQVLQLKTAQPCTGDYSERRRCLQKSSCNTWALPQYPAAMALAVCASSIACPDQ